MSMKVGNNVNGGEIYLYQQPKKKHKFLKAVAITTVAVGGTAIYLKKNKPEVYNAILEGLRKNVVSPMKQTEIPLKERLTTVGKNILGVINKLTSPFGEKGKLVGAGVAGGAAVGAGIVSAAESEEETQAPEELKDKKLNKEPEVVAPADEESEQGETPQEIKTGKEGEEPVVVQPPIVKERVDDAYQELDDELSEGGSSEETSETPAPAPAAQGGKGKDSVEEVSEEAPEEVDEESALAPAPAAEPEAEAEPEAAVEPKKYVIMQNGAPFEGSWQNGVATDKNGAPITGEILVLNENGTRSYVIFDGGKLKRVAIFKGDAEIPYVKKEYKEGMISKVDTDMVKNPNGDIPPYVPATTRHYRDNALRRVTTLEGDTSVERFYRKDVDEQGRVKGKPVYECTVTPVVQADGGVTKFFSVPTADGGERVVRGHEGSKKITFMAQDQSPLGTYEFGNGKVVKSLTMHDSDGVNIASLDLEGGKLGLNPIGFGIPTFPDNDLGGFSLAVETTKNGEKVVVDSDGNGDIARISMFSPNSTTPTCTSTFKNGVITSDIFYDEAGKEVYVSRYTK